jgi:hypothetical protein
VGAAVADTPVAEGTFEAFNEAKAELRAAETACRRTWLMARTGDAVAARRYRAALRRRERALETLRHLHMIPRSLLAARRRLDPTSESSAADIELPPDPPGRSSAMTIRSG